MKFFLIIFSLLVTFSIQAKAIEVTSPYKGCTIWVTLEKKESSWSIFSIDEVRPKQEITRPKELLCTDNQLSIWSPDFDIVYFFRGTWQCDILLAPLRSPVYSPCTTSEFSKASIGGALFKTIATLGLGAGTLIKINDTAVKEAIEKSNTIDTIKEIQNKTRARACMDSINHSTSSAGIGIKIDECKNILSDTEITHALSLQKTLIEKETLQRYRDLFKNINTIQSAQNFISKYANLDPDSLVPKAEIMLKALRNEQERVDRKEREIKENEAKILRQEELMTINWRKTLKVGSETNCGPVIEIKNPMIKVYFPVASYGTEHWIMLNTIQRPGTGCRFINGKYIPN